MAKRSAVQHENELAVEELAVELEEVNSEEEVSDETIVSVVSLTDGTKKVTGAVTGNLYVFNGAGSIVPMVLEDAQKLIEKRNRSCCGSGIVSKIFEIIEEG